MTSEMASSIAQFVILLTMTKVGIPTIKTAPLLKMVYHPYKMFSSMVIIIIIYTTYIAPYIWPVWPFIGAEEGPSKY